MKMKKRHTPTGYCQHCGMWVGYTPKAECPKAGEYNYSMILVRKVIDEMASMPLANYEKLRMS
jgi:hypothetical protein